MSTYSTNLALELIGNGEQAGNWGQTTNTNLGTLVEQAISGYTTQAVSTGTDTTLTMTQGASATARNMYIELTGSGGTNTNLIVPSNKKLYFIFNNTSSGQVTVKVAGQTGVSVPNGTKTILVSNGTDIVLATTSAVTSVAMTVPSFLSVAGSPITSTGTLAVSLSGSALPTANGGTGSTSTAYCSLASNVSGTLPVANGGTGSSSLSGAGIITTGGGQTISGTLTTTGDINTGSGRVVTEELFIATSTAFGPYGAKGNLLWNGALQNGFVMKSTASVDSNAMIILNSSNTPLGSIFLKPSINECTFNNISDYRLKHAIVPMTDALEKVALLKPCTFKWKNNDAESQGFIAHELQEVVPQCVSGEKDAVNEDGSIIPQGVDPRYLVATLTAAIQELKTMVDVQAARITALESQ
jgi:hypothetical protein